MPHTHHWKRRGEFPQAPFARWVAEVRSLVQHHRDVLQGVVLGPEAVAFCGDTPAESFHVPRVFSPVEWNTPKTVLFYDYCWTDNAQYDAVVAAALTSLVEHLPDTQYTRDGGDTPPVPVGRAPRKILVTT